MIQNALKWFGQSARALQRDHSVEHTRQANFGYRRVAAEEKRRLVMRHFNTVAEKYDFMNTLLSFGIQYPWKRRAVRMMNLKPGDRVLDVCGGTGDLSLLAARRSHPGGNVVRYDINRRMMAAGGEKLQENPFGGRVQSVQGNAEILPFPSAAFNAAMIGFGIRNLTYMEKGLAEMHRVLKPGGRFMCLEFSRPRFAPFRVLYDLYSFYAMPLLGELIVGSRRAYLHLPETIRLFQHPAEFENMMHKAGFINIEHHALTNGIATLYLGNKAKEESRGRLIR